MSEALIMGVLAIVPVAAFSGVLGSVVLWRSMAYYGDAMAHAALLGVALALIFPQMPALAFVFAVVLIATFCTQFLEKAIPNISPNTMLGIFAHGALALGVLLSHLSGAAEADIHDWLLGDIHALSFSQIFWIVGGSVAGLLVLTRYWHALVLYTLSEELAGIEGISTRKLKLVLLLLLSLFITLALPILGVLLITALLIIPAATARLIGCTPNQMALFASMIAVIASLVGIILADMQHLPVAPMVVAVFAGTFALVALANKLRK